ncbi:tetratricopeptide repeat protein [Lactobacillus agrestimuris]|uniref:tetratricopeptide repeat protein n=1 Tax=Lactobacillus agrestimuris TaxID=2941328 RepID=UPI0020437562|nr:tetratricopeptide repeat protein [Lactobacillus agrestimuris]
MGSLSQKNLMKLAKENEKDGKTSEAIQNLKEILRTEHSTEAVLELCKLYRKNKQEDQAYAIIKEEPDLFSDQRVYQEYCEILAANNFFIEAKQIEALTGEKLPVQVEPAKLDKQYLIMDLVKRKKEISQIDYEQLLKLDLVNFINFSQSIFIDPTANFAIRLALCEDLIKLKIEDKINILVLGEQTSFIPAKTTLLEKNPIYREIMASVGSKLRNNPSQLPLIIGETNLILGTIFPKISKYIDDPDSFTSDLISYLYYGDGRSHQAEFEKIYKYLPK